MRKQKEKRMSKGNLKIGGRAGASAPTTDNFMDQRRERLAQQIGRLLAHTWLMRRREAETSESSSDDSPLQDSAILAPKVDC